MDNIITGIPHEGHFAATMEGMAQATAFLDEICPNPKLSIVFDEIASNVVRCSGATSFDVKVSRDQDIVLTISDDGSPFDPTQTDDPDVTKKAEDREIGGLGLFMVRKMAKRVDYVREKARNVLTIRL